MIKFSFIHNRKKNNIIECRLYHKGKTRYISTGLKVASCNYKDGVISGIKEARLYNECLRKICTSIENQLQLQLVSGAWDINAIYISKNNTDNFLDWALSILNNENIASKTYNSLASTLSQFSKFVKTFDDITLSNIKQFNTYLLQKGLCQTSIANYHIYINKYIRLAIKKKIIAYNPYNDFEYNNGRSKEREYLTLDELLILERSEFHNRVQNKARDLFLFSCYTGLAYSDIIKIKRSDVVNKHIIGYRKKTNVRYDVTLCYKALAILERYDYDLFFHIQYLNVILKKIMSKLGINKHISFHCARHSFATIALNKGVPIEVVSKMLAHTNIQTTQIYAKILGKTVEDGYRTIWGE